MFSFELTSLFVSTRRCIAAILPSLLLSACAVSSGLQPTALPESVDVGGQSIATKLGNAASGSVVILDRESVASSGLFGSQVDAKELMVDRVYTSANDRACRRILKTNGVFSGRIVCREHNGNWTFVRSLQSSYLDAAERAQEATMLTANGVNATNKLPLVDTPNAVLTTPSNKVADIPKDALLDQTSWVARARQKLWSFSARVTGHALNWPGVAKANGIEQATARHSGTVLKVPVELIAK